jgi:histone H3/H4
MKKSHYFEIYINRVLKQISDTNTLTLNAKQQLNSFICIFINRLSCDVRKLLEFIDKKICTSKEVSNILNIILTGQLLEHCLSEGQKAVETFNSFKSSDASSSSYVSKIDKAGILFSPSLVEKFMKQQHIMISQVSHVSIFIAAVCEYIIHEILDIAVMNCQKKRITVQDLQLAVENDIELSALFKTLNASFLINNSKTNNKLILAKSSFSRLVRQYTNRAKLPKMTLATLQTYIEKYIIDLLTNASYLATHGNRIKLLPIDIQLTCAISQNLPSQNPYIIKKNDDLLMMM